MRKAGERDLNPAVQSRANYTSPHNGAHLNVAMQIARSSFLWIRKPAMSGRIKGYYACKAVYFFPLTWGKIDLKMREALECLHNLTQKITQGIFKGFLSVSSLSLSLFGHGEKRDQICVCQAHYNDPWILMASFLIDNYRHRRTEPCRRGCGKNEKENVSR